MGAIKACLPPNLGMIDFLMFRIYAFKGIVLFILNLFGITPPPGGGVYSIQAES
jgi:hypothetical protein